MLLPQGPGERALKTSIQVVLCFVALLLCHGLLSNATAAPFETSKADGIPWSFETKSEVVAVGDVHGDLSALAAILERRGLVDSAGRWKGGARHLVLMGDYVDRGPDTREIVDWLIRLESEAATTGGRVHTLLGNHEMMVLTGDLRYTTRAEHAGFSEFQRLPMTAELAESLGVARRRASIVAALRHIEPYASWIATRSAIVRINRTVFVHAGIDQWAQSTTPAEVNATLRRWIRHYQGAERRPAKAQAWVLDELGPLWTRSLAEGELAVELIERYLKQMASDQLVVGHSVTETGRIERRYGGKVVMIDTGISSYYEGGLGSLVLRGEKLRAMPLVERPKKEHPLVALLRARRLPLCGHLAERYGF